MDEEFCNDVKRQVIAHIGAGRRHFVYWGLNENCLRILSDLHDLAPVGSHLSGIVDPDHEKQEATPFGCEVSSPDRVKNLDLDVLVICVDKEKEEALRHFSRVDRRLPQVIVSGTGHFEFEDPTFRTIQSSCLVKSYATGYSDSLAHLYQAIKYLSDSELEGSVAEFGMFKGGTTEFIARALKHFGFEDLRIYGFEAFGGFPPRKSVLDLYTNPECEYHDSRAVEVNASEHGIVVIKGDICETYHRLDGIPLMLSFFDTDNYTPTRMALELCFEQTVKGGILAFDHYVSVDRFIYTVGERIAAREVLSDKKVFNLHGTGIFIKL